MNFIDFLLYPRIKDGLRKAPAKIEVLSKKENFTLLFTPCFLRGTKVGLYACFAREESTVFFKKFHPTYFELLSNLFIMEWMFLPEIIRIKTLGRFTFGFSGGYQVLVQQSKTKWACSHSEQAPVFCPVLIFIRRYAPLIFLYNG